MRSKTVELAESVSMFGVETCRAPYAPISGRRSSTMTNSTSLAPVGAGDGRGGGGGGPGGAGGLGARPGALPLVQLPAAVALAASHRWQTALSWLRVHCTHLAECWPQNEQHPATSTPAFDANPTPVAAGMHRFGSNVHCAVGPNANVTGTRTDAQSAARATAAPGGWRRIATSSRTVVPRERRCCWRR